jgi:hypothetical protein
MRPTWILMIALAVSAGCTTLGPVPVATGISPIPRSRFDGELQLGGMPGYYLSSATQQNPRGSALLQVSAVIEPGAAVPGLILGGRITGNGPDTATDPMIGYRTAVGPDRRISIAGVAFGARASGDSRGASYKATRIGGEVSGDLRLGPQRPWFEPHLELAFSVTGLSASGDYCTDMSNFGHDCPDPPALPVLRHASVSGAYPSAVAGASLLIAHHHESWIHGARLVLLIGAGLMPRVVDEQQASAQPYFSGGFALSLAIGAPR